MQNEPNQEERQRVGLTINAPEKLAHGRDKQPKKANEPQAKNDQPNAAPSSTAEHKEPHRSKS